MPRSWWMTGGRWWRSAGSRWWWESLATGTTATGRLGLSCPLHIGGLTSGDSHGCNKERKRRWHVEHTDREDRQPRPQKHHSRTPEERLASCVPRVGKLDGQQRSAGQQNKHKQQQDDVQAFCLYCRRTKPSSLAARLTPWYVGVNANQAPAAQARAWRRTDG